jgi:hypothetical protein
MPWSDAAPLAAIKVLDLGRDHAASARMRVEVEYADTIKLRVQMHRTLQNQD